VAEGRQKDRNVDNSAVRSQPRHVVTQTASLGPYTAATRLRYMARAGSEGEHGQAIR
jgi:hypothetical protein